MRAVGGWQCDMPPRVRETLLAPHVLECRTVGRTPFAAMRATEFGLHCFFDQSQELRRDLTKVATHHPRGFDVGRRFNGPCLSGMPWQLVRAMTELDVRKFVCNRPLQIKVA